MRPIGLIGGQALDPARHFVFSRAMPRGSLLILVLLILALGASACAPPATLRQPVIGASFAPVASEFPPLPAIMERTGDAPIALPEPSSFTPIGAPRSDPAARP